MIDDAMAASKGFFKLSADDKNSVSVNQQQRGWLAPGMAKFTAAKTHDLKEIFFFGPESWSDAMLAKKNEIALIADNQWPDCCPSLKAGIMPYYGEVYQLGIKFYLRLLWVWASPLISSLNATRLR